MSHQKNQLRIACQATIRETLANVCDTSQQKPGATLSPLKQTIMLPMSLFSKVSLAHMENPSQYLARYLFCIIERQNLALGSCLKLPSLLCLARHFGVTPSEMHEAFVQLKHYGFDFQIPGLYGAVTLWLQFSNRHTDSEGWAFPARTVFGNSAVNF